MSLREGLGYSLRSYDPCFSYNADRFCCSDRGYKFRQNVLLSDTALVRDNSYGNINYNDPNDNRPLWLVTTGVVDPQSYTLAPVERDYTWCSRIPCGLDQKGRPPCQKDMPVCFNPAVCKK